MRLPVHSERDAYRIVWATVALAAVSILVGALIHPLVGLGLFVVVVIAAVVYDLRVKDPDRLRPLREAEHAGRTESQGAAPRLLVVANQTLGGQELQAELSGRRPRPELRVVAPILCSRAKYVMSDIDTELVLARERLDKMLAWAGAQGFTASGDVCAEGPLMALEDELRGFGPEEVLISTHTPERSNWLEAGVVERAREELDIPVSHVVVDLERSRLEDQALPTPR
jgi:GABA permease